MFWGTSDAGGSKPEPDITWPGKNNIIINEAEFNRGFIILKCTLELCFPELVNDRAFLFHGLQEFL